MKKKYAVAILSTLLLLLTFTAYWSGKGESEKYYEHTHKELAYSNPWPEELRLLPNPGYEINLAKRQDSIEHHDHHQGHSHSLLADDDPSYSCPNIVGDTFDERWEGYAGYITRADGIVTNTGPGIVAGRHEIITESTLDVSTCEKLPTIFPGSDYSIKLGNEMVGAQAESLRFTMRVDPENPLFIYRYAVVLQDPNHPTEQQPRFELNITDTAGNLIDPNCGFYKVVARADLPGYDTCPTRYTVFSKWQSVGIDLTPFADQDLILEFKTGDCTEGGHFGYAYFEPLACQPFELIASNYCPETSNTILLEAPEGFEYLWSTGDTTRTVTVSDPSPGDTYSCTLTSSVNAACQISLSYTIPPFEKESISFKATPDVCKKEYAFDASDTELPGGGSVDEFIWDFGDGETQSSGNDPTTSHTYNTAGTYTVELLIKAGTCEFIRTLEVDAAENVPGVIEGEQTVCEGMTPRQIDAPSAPSSEHTYRFQWQNSVDGIDFEDITAATTETYQPPALVKDTWYRRLDIFEVEGQDCIDMTNVVLVTVNNIDPAPKIDQNQLHCLGEASKKLTEVSAATSRGTITYQWYSSTDGVTYAAIAGATASEYDPGVLPETTWFYRTDSSELNRTVCTIDSNIIQIQVNYVNPGVIADDGTYCFGETAQTITENTKTSASGIISHQWQSSLNGADFEDIAGATSPTFDPGTINNDVWLRRLDRSTLDTLVCEKPTNVVKLSMNRAISATFEDEITICEDQETPVLIELEAGSTVGEGTYQWERSLDGIDFEPMAGETAKTLAPGTLENDTWFRRIDTSILNGVSCQDISNLVRVYLNKVAPGSLIEDKTICSNSSPGEITSNIDPTGSGEISFQWQISSDGSNFNDIVGTDDASFNIGELTDDTWYRRVCKSTLNGVECTKVTDPIKINVLRPIVVPEPSLVVGTCQDVDDLGPATLVTVNGLEISGGTGTYLRYEFHKDLGSDLVDENETLLQSGSSNFYIHPDPEPINIRVVVFDELGCSGESKISLPGFEPLSATFIVGEELCVGDGNGSIDLDIKGGFPPYHTAIDGGNDGFVQDRTKFFDLTGGRQYTVRIRDNNGCEIELLVPFEAPVDLTPDLRMQYYCDEGANSSRNSLFIGLDPSLLDGVLFTLDNDASTTKMEPEFHDLEPGIHTLSIAYKNGCVKEGYEFIVEGYDPLVLELDTKTRNVIRARASGGKEQYLFSFDDRPFGSSSRFVVDKTGEYVVIVMDALGCEVALTVFVEFFPVHIPNFFTPDGDGINDGWRPDGIDQYPNAVTLVFDRYGRVVAELGYLEYWDGIYEGAPMPSGDYWYVLQDEEAEEQSKDPIMGHFTLYR